MKRYVAVVLVLCLVAAVSCAHSPGSHEVHEAPEADSDVQAAIEFGLKETSKKGNRQYFLGLESIEKVETQVVAGILYHIYIRAGESSCKTSDYSVNLKNCKPAKSTKSCKLEVLHKAWENKRELVSSSCA